MQDAQETGMRDLLEKLGIAGGTASGRGKEQEHKDHYAFWETQPVPQYSDEATPSAVRPVLISARYTIV